MAMMVDVREDARFYCFGAGVDMRKGIQGLYSLIRVSGDGRCGNGSQIINGSD